MVSIKMENEYILTFEDDERYAEQIDKLKKVLEDYNIQYEEFNHVKGLSFSIDKIAEKSEMLFQELSQLEGLLIEETNEFKIQDKKDYVSADDSLKTQPYKTDDSDDKKYE